MQGSNLKPLRYQCDTPQADYDFQGRQNFICNQVWGWYVRAITENKAELPCCTGYVVNRGWVPKFCPHYPVKKPQRQSSDPRNSPLNYWLTATPTACVCTHGKGERERDSTLSRPPQGWYTLSLTGTLGAGPPHCAPLLLPLLINYILNTLS